MANIGDLRIQIEAIDNASATLSKVSNNLKSFSASATAQTKGISGIGSAIGGLGKQSKTGAMGMLKMGAAAGAAFLGIQSLGIAVKDLGMSMINNASDMEQNRVAFETMLGSAEKAGQLLSDISDFAAKTPFQLPEVVEGSKRLLAYNVAAQDIIPTFKMLGDVSAALGKDKLNPLITAFGQISAKGRLMGQELLQLREAGFNLAEAMGISNAKLEEMVSNGEVSFKDVREAFKKTTSEGGKYFNMMEKQSETFGGTLSNLQDTFTRLGLEMLGVNKKGEILAGGAFAQLSQASKDLLKWLNENTYVIRMWASAAINGFSFVVRGIWNIVQALGRIIATPFALAYGAALDGLQNIQNAVENPLDAITGKLQKVTSNFDYAWSITLGGVGQDIRDISESFENSFVNFDKSMDAMVADAGKVSKLGGAASDSADEVSEMSKQAKKELESLSKKVEDVYKKIGKENKSYKKEQGNLKDDYKDDLKEMETDLEKTLVNLEKDFTKEMTKLRENYNKEMTDLQTQLTADLAKIDDTFNKSELGKEKDYRNSIAQTIVDKQTQINDLQKQMLAEQSSEKRWEMAQQIKDIQDFLEKHKEDATTYADEITAINQYQAMDEIDQLKFKNAQEKAERLRAYEEEKAERIKQYNEKVAETIAQYEADKVIAATEHAEKIATEIADDEDDRKKRKDQYKKDLDDVKDSHKEKLKELKDYLNEAKKALADFVNSKEVKKTEKLVGSGSSSSGIASNAGLFSGRATGGIISRNNPYIVGEKGPELIVPSSGGRVIPTQNLQAASQAGGPSINIKVDVGMYAGSHTEKRKLGQEILDAINQTRRSKGLGALA